MQKVSNKNIVNERKKSKRVHSILPVQEGASIHRCVLILVEHTIFYVCYMLFALHTFAVGIAHKHTCSYSQITYDEYNGNLKHESTIIFAIEYECRTKLLLQSSVRCMKACAIRSFIRNRKTYLVGHKHNRTTNRSVVIQFALFDRHHCSRYVVQIQIFVYLLFG